MKKILISMLAIAGFAVAQAQVDNEVSTATLVHGDQTTVYQGVNAFIAAYNAAADTLDVITLSPGSFYPPEKIQKSITIRGAGFEGDSTKRITRTRVGGDINITPGEGKNINGITIEGIRCRSLCVQGNDQTPADQQLHNLNINKCYMEGRVQFLSLAHDVTLSRCYVTNSIVGNHSNYNDYVSIDNLQLFNCIISSVDRFLNNSTSFSNIMVNHCIINQAHNNGSYVGLGAYVFYNCIINGNVPSGGTVRGCILINQSQLNDNVEGDGNYFGKQIADVLADGSSSLEYYVNDVPHSLAVKDEFVGIDNTPVGVFGGIMPWNPIPSLPRITDFKTTVSDDNKTLHVSIKADVPGNP